MAECGHGRLADGKAVLREQFGNRPVGGALLPEFGDDVSSRGQFLETL